MGPTAVGKTDLAIELYHEFKPGIEFELISVDSAMVYKGLNIGTGKPEASILKEVPHHLVDIREVYEIYNVADFCEQVYGLIDRAHANNKVPLLVGGTMMYYKALQQGMDVLPKSNQDIRDKLLIRLSTEGIASLYSELERVDIASARRIKPNDKQRIMRALEVFYIAGKTMSELLNKQSDVRTGKYKYINIAMNTEHRSVIHDRINLRFHKMLGQGFIEEVEELFLAAKHNKHITSSLPALRSCGYRQIWNYLEGVYTREEMIEKSIVSTRQLAKRQLTWLRSWHDIYWLNIQDSNFKDKVINYLESFDLRERIV